MGFTPFKENTCKSQLAFILRKNLSNSLCCGRFFSIPVKFISSHCTHISSNRMQTLPATTSPLPQQDILPKPGLLFLSSPHLLLVSVSCPAPSHDTSILSRSNQAIHQVHDDSHSHLQACTQSHTHTTHTSFS